MGVRSSSGAPRRSDVSVYLIVAAVVAASIGVALFVEAYGGSNGTGGAASPSPSPNTLTVFNRTYSVPASQRASSQNATWVYNFTAVEWFNVSFSSPVPISACAASGDFVYVATPYANCSAAAGSRVLTDVVSGHIALDVAGSTSPVTTFAVEVLTTYSLDVAYRWWENSTTCLNCSERGQFVVAPGELSTILTRVNTTLPDTYSAVNVTAESSVSLYEGYGMVGGYLTAGWHSESSGTTWSWNGTYAGSALLSVVFGTISPSTSRLTILVTVS